MRTPSWLDTTHDREILALALPALGSLAIDPIVSLVDTAFVGRLGAAPLGALGINASIFAMTFVVFNFLAYGTTPRIGQAVGRGELEEAGQVVTRALALALLCGLVALGLLEGAAPWILEAMGARGPMYEPALTYLRIRALAGPAVLLTTAAHGSYRGFQDTRTPMLVAVGVNLVNLGLDPLLIFGLGWGIAGAACATVVAQWLGAGVFLWLLLVRQRRRWKIPLRWPAPGELARLLQVGSSLLLRTGALVGTMALGTAVAARVGVAAAAAHQVVNELWGFLALVVDALAVAAQALVSRHLGQGSRGRARAVADRLLFWGLGGGVVLAGLMALGRPVLPGLFTDDPGALAGADRIFVFVIALQPLNGLVFVWDGIYMGAEAFGYLARAMIASALVAATILLLVHPMGWGLEGVWWGVTALMLVRLVTLAIPYLRGGFESMVEPS